MTDLDKVVSTGSCKGVCFLFTVCPMFQFTHSFSEKRGSGREGGGLLTSLPCTNRRLDHEGTCFVCLPYRCDVTLSTTQTTSDARRMNDGLSGQEIRAASYAQPACSAQQRFVSASYIVFKKAKSTNPVGLQPNVQLLPVQMAAVSSSMQLNDEDTPIAQPEQEQQDRGEPPHPSRTPPAPPAAAEHYLPTITESAHSTANSPSAASARTRSEELGSPDSRQAASEFAFDSLDIPVVVETRTVAGESAEGSVVARQITEAGQEVITVVLSEEERQLKDSAKEMHEQGKGKGKAGILQPPGRQHPSVQVTELICLLQ